jgi:uncharacterized protein YcfJ
MPRPYAASVLALVLLATSGIVRAENVVAQPGNIRTEYAEVLRVEPIYQTLRAYATEERCDPIESGNGPRSGMSRWMSSLRDTDKGAQEAGNDKATRRNCRTVRVPREYRRPVAYDVDYIHRGVKYRSRLPFDPGKRLRVKVMVTPDLAMPGKP